MHDLVQIGPTTIETLDVKVLEQVAELNTRNLLEPVLLVSKRQYDSPQISSLPYTDIQLVL